MRWRSHRSIAKAISKKMALPEGYEQILLEGVIEPDRHKERMEGRGRSYRISHHGASDRIIMLHVWIARRKFLVGDQQQCLRHLGMALHYVHDRYTSKGFLGLGHDRREERLSKIPVPIRAVEEGWRDSRSSPAFIASVVSRIRARKDVDKIMFEATRTSASIARAVINERKPSDIAQAYLKERRNHFLWRMPVQIGAISIGLSLSFLSISLLPGIIGAIVAFILLMNDSGYRRLSKEIDWWKV